MATKGVHLHLYNKITENSSPVAQVVTGLFSFLPITGGLVPKLIQFNINY